MRVSSNVMNILNESPVHAQRGLPHAAYIWLKHNDLEHVYYTYRNTLRKLKSSLFYLTMVFLFPSLPWITSRPANNNDDFITKYYSKIILLKFTILVYSYESRTALSFNHWNT